MLVKGAHETQYDLLGWNDMLKCCTGNLIELYNCCIVVDNDTRGLGNITIDNDRNGRSATQCAGNTQSVKKIYADWEKEIVHAIRHIESETKWTRSCRQHFKTYYLNEDDLILISQFFPRAHYHWFIIALDNDLTPNRPQPLSEPTMALFT